LENTFDQDFNREFKELLFKRTINRLPENTGKPSAVLIPLYYSDGRHYLVFTKRTTLVSYHKGEISFPGGGYHKEDRNLLTTALRETREEIGLDSQKVEILGELDDKLTKYSQYIITPFVGSIPAGSQFVLSPNETAEVLQIPVPALRDLKCRRDEPTTLYGQDITTYFYTYQNHTIIGATARILKQFLDIYEKVWCGLK
jgi:8-oxo-dGTP pyrophosphatase MutT (NUDIX family)